MFYGSTVQHCQMLMKKRTRRQILKSNNKPGSVFSNQPVCIPLYIMNTYSISNLWILLPLSQFSFESSHLTSEVIFPARSLLWGFPFRQKQKALLILLFHLSTTIVIRIDPLIQPKFDEWFSHTFHLGGLILRED